jgi:tRNA threonylcarbamoyladenosine biosynthesis protein TsaB
MICADSSNDAGLILALNGADERLQITLGRLRGPVGVLGLTDAATGGPADAEFLASQEWTVPGQAMRFLAPGVRHMLDNLGANAQDIRAIACVHGPGSFTGLRMSLALSEGLAAGTGAQLAGLGHLELLAHEAAQEVGAVLALSWSRRGQVYAQVFQDDQALTPPTVVFLTALPQFLAPLPRPLFVLGGGLRRNLPVFQDLAKADAGLRLLPPLWDAPRPQTLLALAARAHFGPGPLLPVYLRASDAEDNLAAIAAGRGLSEPEAQAILARGSRTLS